MIDTRYEVRYLLWCSEEDEPEAGHSRQPDVVAHVRNSDVQQSPDGVVVGRPAVRHSNGIHGAVAQDRIAVPGELLDSAFSRLFLTVRMKRGGMRAGMWEAASDQQ